MNDRQVDELLALEAIYPDTASWRILPPSEAGGEELVEVKVVLPVEFGEEGVEVEVWDWVAPPSPPVTPVRRVEGLAKGVEALNLGTEEEEKTDLTVEEGAAGRGRGAPGRRRRGRGGGDAVNEKGAERRSQQQKLAPEAAPFQPSSSRSNGQGRRGAAPSSTTTTTSAAPPKVSVPRRPPAPTSPSAPSSSSSAAPLPPLSAEGKAPRIRFAPRPVTPPSSSSLAPPTASTSALPSTTTSLPPQPVRLNVRYLPPLELVVLLGAGYPEVEGPRGVRLREKREEGEEEMKWVGEERLRAAERRLKEVYTGEECLFPLIDLVSSSSDSFLATLSLSTPLILRQSPPSSSASLSTPLSVYLTAFNQSQHASAFLTTSHLCPLCFTPHRGSSCIRLSSCGCVFCTPCLRDYFGLLIKEGLVRSVACPARGCVERRGEWEKRGGKEESGEKPGRVSAEEVERLCGVEGRERWEWLREKVRVESDPTIAFCPIDSCQAACPQVEDEEKLRICPKCSYSFCLFCRLTWHGTRNPCALPQSSAIVSSYLSGTPSERQALEMRYGAANLRRLVKAYEEERALREWLDKNSTRCPGCDIPIEKSHGCNHVTCAKCQTHLCYRCGKSISPTDPYKHFSTQGTACYGKLFDFNPGNEPGVEEWIGEIIAQEEDGGGH